MISCQDWWEDNYSCHMKSGHSNLFSGAAWLKIAPSRVGFVTKKRLFLLPTITPLVPSFQSWQSKSISFPLYSISQTLTDLKIILPFVCMHCCNPRFPVLLSAALKHVYWFFMSTVSPTPWQLQYSLASCSRLLTFLQKSEVSLGLRCRDHCTCDDFCGRGFFAGAWARPLNAARVLFGKVPLLHQIEICAFTPLAGWSETSHWGYTVLSVTSTPWFSVC